MKKSINILLCFVLLMVSYTLININKFEIKEYKSVINAKTYMAAAPTYITRIDINLTDKAKVSPAYSYSEMMYLFENESSFTNENLTGSNVYFAFCPSSSKCDYDDATFVNGNAVEYSTTVMDNKYHWADFEVEITGCRGEEAVCDYDFDKNHLDQIEVYVNGVKNNDAFVRGYNTYWHLVDVYVPVGFYSGSIVRSITVDSDSSYVQKGTTSTFTASIKAYGAGTNNVTWTVSGNESNNTTINSSGVLSVASNETSLRVKVRATSTYDNTVYGEKEVEVIDEPLSITDVTFTRQVDTVVYGGSFEYSAIGNGTGNRDVTWSITGANKAGTTIDSAGNLTVAEDETATSIVVTATSVFDTSKKANLTVTLRNTEYVNKIEISYDTSKVVFSSKTTYNAVKSILKDIWELPENANYDKGNNNIWMDYCDTSLRCTDDEEMTGGYSENMLADRYTYVDFQVFAKPSGDSYMPNPLYDFDGENLEDIEVWVNGVKRDDVLIKFYNDAWRMIHVFVPVTVTDGKINQSFSFNYETVNADYGDAPFVNNILSYNRVGDGEITYESSDTSIATVDNDGYVTIKKIGTCTITAYASETEDYKAYSNSYTLNVEPLYMYPTITGPDMTFYYTGSSIEPEITVTYSNIPLVKDVDYTISYEDNLNSGYGRVYIHPVDGSNYDFNDNRYYQFYIYRKYIQQEDITISPTSVLYDGNPKEVNVTVVVDGRTLVKDTDYELSYHGNTSIGSAYVRVSGINNYDGVRDVVFEIVEFEKGDMNKDGEIGLTDVISLLRLYLGVEAETDENILIGDMNEDGDIGLSDVIMLLRVYLGIE